MNGNATKKALKVLGIVGVGLHGLGLAGLLFVASCSLALAPNRHLPRPPRRSLTIEKAQRYHARLFTPKYLNRRYQSPRPR
jgi:hypothetical protein